GTGARLHEALAARAAIAEQLPVGLLLKNLGGGESLEGAVVPLRQVRLDPSAACKTRQLASSPSALGWAGEHAGETQSFQALAQPDRIALAALGERYVGAAGVLPGTRPGGL